MKKILPLIIVLILLLSMTVSASEYTEEEKLAALFEANVSEIADAIKSGLVTSRQVTQYYLERINEYNDKYNCFITICDDALYQADVRDAKLAMGKAEGLLYGVPVVIKDNMDYKGYPTTNGYAKSRAPVAEENAYVVQRLLDEGAVIIGKTNMSTGAEYASNSTSIAAGMTFNAYNTDMLPGGSSGGSAAAVSLNFAAAGLGTDTNSSLRMPAALNGCVSLRVTTGLIPTDGCVPLNEDRDTPGAITRTVIDQALMLDVLTDGKYSYTEKLDGKKVRGKTFGIVSELCFDSEKISERNKKNYDAEVFLAFSKATDELKRLGARIVYISVPNIENLYDMCDEAYSSSDKNKEKFLNTLKEAMGDEVDALIYPTYISSPQYADKNKSNQPFYSNCFYISPALGLPEISLPIGMHSRGAGIGMEICAMKNEEQLLLDIAYSYTESCNHRDIPENAPNLHTGNTSLADILYASSQASAEIPFIGTFLPDIPVQKARKIHYLAASVITAATALAASAALIIFITDKKNKDA